MRSGDCIVNLLCRPHIPLHFKKTFESVIKEFVESSVDLHSQICTEYRLHRPPQKLIEILESIKQRPLSVYTCSKADFASPDEETKDAVKWININLRSTALPIRNLGLVVFDMDSTLIQQEVIDLIAAQIGVETQVSAITAEAMNGNLDFNHSLIARTALLKGTPSRVFEDIKPKITITPGAKQLIFALKSIGAKTAVVSGGFVLLVKWLQAQLGLDYAFANTLEISKDGTVLTGRVIGEIVNADKKASLLNQLAAENNLGDCQTLAIGDGANDLKMMREANYGIAFNAKPKVQIEAPAKLNSTTLLDILYLCGYSDEEQENLLVGTEFEKS